MSSLLLVLIVNCGGSFSKIGSKWESEGDIETVAFITCLDLSTDMLAHHKIAHTKLTNE